MNPDLDKDLLRVKRLGKLPIPITLDIYEKFFAEGAIRKKDLIAGETYLGICRNSDFTRWDGERFIYTRYDFEPIKFTSTQYYKSKGDAIFTANPKELYNLISDIENWTTKYNGFREDVVKINRKIWQS